MPTLPSYTSGTSEKPLLGMTIGDMFDATVKRFPDNDALIVLHQNIRWTYKELHSQVNLCARAFLAAGVRRGDRVAIWSPNRYEWTLTQFATAKIGAILVNINPAYRTHELEYALNQSESRYLVTADSFKASDYRGMLYELAPELKMCAEGQLDSQKLPLLKGVINLDDHKHPGMWRWQDFMALAENMPQGNSG